MIDIGVLVRVLSCDTTDGGFWTIDNRLGGGLCGKTGDMFGELSLLKARSSCNAR